MSNVANQAAIRQLRFLCVIVVLASGAWGFNFWRQWQEAPVRQHIEAGRQAIARGQGGVAESEWRQAAQINPRNAEAWELLGDFYAAAQDWGRARDCYVRLTEISPETPRAWSRLAVAAARIEDTSNTTRAVEEALRRNPDDADALGLKSSLLARDKKWDEQLKTLRRLVQLQPENMNVMARLADALTAQKMFDEARPLLDKIIKAEPNFAPAYAMRGEGAMAPNATLAQLQQAEKDLQKSLQLDGSQVKARELFAEVLLRRGKTAQGVAQYEKLIAAHPYQTIYLNALANAYVKIGEGATALALRRRVAAIAEARDRRDVLESRVANDPNSFENNLALGLLLIRSPEPIDAYKYIEKAVKLRPRDPRALSASRELEEKYKKHLIAGMAAVRAGDLKKADLEISRAMLLRPRDARTTQAVQSVVQAAQKTATP